MAHYSRTRGWVSRPSRAADTGPNPYDTGSPRFAERHRETETALAGGILRIDVGEPVQPLPSEGLRPKAAKVGPVPSSADTLAPDPLPAPEPSPAPPKRPRREPWGLNRDEC